MGLWDKLTANVLKYDVAKFYLERLKLPKQNTLLDGPIIPDYEQLRRKYKIPVRRVPYPHWNTQSIEFEPTKMGSTTRPATRTWKVHASFTPLCLLLRHLSFIVAQHV